MQLEGKIFQLNFYQAVSEFWFVHYYIYLLFFFADPVLDDYRSLPPPAYQYDMSTQPSLSSQTSTDSSLSSCSSFSTVSSIQHKQPMPVQHLPQNTSVKSSFSPFDEGSARHSPNFGAATLTEWKYPSSILDNFPPDSHEG